MVAQRIKDDREVYLADEGLVTGPSTSQYHCCRDGHILVITAMGAVFLDFMGLVCLGNKLTGLYQNPFFMSMLF